MRISALALAVMLGAVFGGKLLRLKQEEARVRREAKAKLEGEANPSAKAISLMLSLDPR